jgi:hypothetical protein
VALANENVAEHVGSLKSQIQLPDKSKFWWEYASYGLALEIWHRLGAVQHLWPLFLKFSMSGLHAVSTIFCDGNCPSMSKEGPDVGYWQLFL